MIRLKPSRSEQVRFAAAFLAVNALAPKVLAQQQARTYKTGPRYRRCAAKKMLNKYVRSLNVYENKGTQDTMPERNQTFRS